MEDFARVDNDLTSAQLAIGESSNLAQLALTYTYSFNEQKFTDAVCILSVIAQVAIDNAKRKYEINLPDEIKRIKQLIDIGELNLPKFWLVTKKDKRKFSSEEKKRKALKNNKEKILQKLNIELDCPMNYIYDLKFPEYHDPNPVIPISEFFVKHDLEVHKRKCKKVEELIQKYSLELHNISKAYEESNWEDEQELLLRDDFESLVQDIRKINISKNYAGLMSWLINRAFKITEQTRGNMNSKLNKNKSILIKVLYTVNPDVFLSCFEEKVDSAQ